MGRNNTGWWQMRKVKMRVKIEWMKECAWHIHWSRLFCQKEHVGQLDNIWRAGHEQINRSCHLCSKHLQSSSSQTSILSKHHQRVHCFAHQWIVQDKTIKHIPRICRFESWLYSTRVMRSTTAISAFFISKDNPEHPTELSSSSSNVIVCASIRWGKSG